MRPAPEGGRSAALAHFRQARDAARAAQVNYWVFEHESSPGRWVEFVEAADAGRLRMAAARMQLPSDDASILREVELD